MRLDKLIRDSFSNSITEAHYKRLKEKWIFFPIVEYRSCGDNQGWDTERLDRLSEEEARRMLGIHWQLKRYEQQHGIEPTVREMMIHVVDDPEAESPEWPPELKKYNTDYFAEAYLCEKFGLRPPA